MSGTGLQRELHKMIQNFFVFKSSSPLNAKAASKCPKPSTSGKLKCETTPAADEPAPDPEEAQKAMFWKKITFFGAFPMIGLIALIAFATGDDEDEKERPPFVKYEHMRIRSKKYPWSDGVKTLFHNPRVNALPDGYEE